MTKALTVTANFNPCYAVTTAVNPAGSGSVGSSPAPNCGAGYTKDTVVKLTASPNMGYSFANWSGDVTGIANPTTITVTKALTATANFNPCYAVTKAVNPAGSGRVG